MRRPGSTCAGSPARPRAHRALIHLATACRALRIRLPIPVPWTERAEQALGRESHPREEARVRSWAMGGDSHRNLLRRPRQDDSEVATAHLGRGRLPSRAQPPDHPLTGDGGAAPANERDGGALQAASPTSSPAPASAPRRNPAAGSKSTATSTSTISPSAPSGTRPHAPRSWSGTRTDPSSSVQAHTICRVLTGRFFRRHGFGAFAIRVRGAFGMTAKCTTGLGNRHDVIPDCENGCAFRPIPPMSS